MSKETLILTLSGSVLGKDFWSPRPRTKISTKKFTICRLQNLSSMMLGEPKFLISDQYFPKWHCQYSYFQEILIYQTPLIPQQRRWRNERKQRNCEVEEEVWEQIEIWEGERRINIRLCSRRRTTWKSTPIKLCDHAHYIFRIILDCQKLEFWRKKLEKKSEF